MIYQAKNKSVRVGNTYMNYPRAISSLRGVAECLSDFAFQQFPPASADRSFNGE